MSALLAVREVYRFFHTRSEEIFALRGVSFDVQAGEIVAIAGPSGSGKSTLLMCCAGVDEPDGGYVEVAGERITRKREPERAAIRARALGVMLQSDNLVPHLSVEQNVTTTQRLAGRKPNARALLEHLGLDDVRHDTVGTLSGGEAARAALAVALANDAQVLLADEPTGELDPDAARAVAELLRQRADGGAAIVVVTHTEAMAAAADRVLTLEAGRLVDG
jgi:putative ABC transport system ATP-binding protein